MSKLGLPELQSALDDFMQKYFRGGQKPDAEMQRLVELGRGASPEFLEQATHSLGNPSPEVVIKACITLGAGKFKEAVPVLLDKLAQGNVLVVGAIIFALGEIGDLRAVRPLEGYFARGLLREDIAEAFAKIGDLDPVSYLALALEDKDTRVRLYAAGALASLLERHAGTEALSEYQGLVPRLEAAITDVFPPVRLLAAASLAALGRGFSAPEVRMLVEATLKSKDLSPLESFFTRKT